MSTVQNSIIDALKSSPDYLSGEELSRRVKISRSAVWKHMQEFRRLGYVIDAVPHRGYRLASAPDKLFPWETGFGLTTRMIGRSLVHYDSVGSTMEEAFRLAGEGAEAGTVICAETQTRGRGRMGRTWMSPPEGGIYFSLILRPAIAPAQAARFTLWAAVALHDGLHDATGLKLGIKWPNDIMLDGKKCCGILTELHAETDRVTCLIIGAGINVNTPVGDLPETGTSLQAAAGQRFVRVDVLKAVLQALDRWYAVCQRDGFAAVWDYWKRHTETLRRPVTVMTGRGNIRGRAVDVTDDGALVVQKDSGETLNVFAGDVV